MAIAALPLALAGSPAVAGFTGASLAPLMSASAPALLSMFGGGGGNPMQGMMQQMLMQNALGGMGQGLGQFGQSQAPQQQIPPLIPAQMPATGRQPAPYTPPPYMFPFLPEMLRGLPGISRLGGR